MYRSTVNDTVNSTDVLPTNKSRDPVVKKKNYETHGGNIQGYCIYIYYFSMTYLMAKTKMAAQREPILIKHILGICSGILNLLPL